MIETGKSPAITTKKPTLTPKAIIHQRFGDKACYKVEEVQDSTENGCPGLAIQQKGPCLFRCTLHLPETTVVSDIFKRKKDAEQSAAEKAIEKLGIRQKEYNPTVQEAWDDLAGRLAFLLSDEFLSSPHPLSGHFRAALTREGHLNGCVPVSVIAVYDAKISNICQYINPDAEANTLLVMSLVLKAAVKRTDLVLIPDEQLAVQRRNPYPPEAISSIHHELNLGESIPFEVIRIPVSLEKAVKPLVINITATGYYLDVIAHELGLMEASYVQISRTIGKASSETRIYSSAPKKHVFDDFPEPQVKQATYFEGSLNARASYFTHQEIYGDAILASVGYPWKSTDLFHEAVSLRSYYRMLVNMIPSGAYKISRNAILAAKLPLAFSTKSNWRGSYPREILCTFSRLHHLSEPVFSTQSILLDSSVDLPGSRKKLKVTQSSSEEKSAAGLTTATGDPLGSLGPFNCEVKIYSKNQELIIQCSPQESHRKQNDAIQSAALKVLSWLNIFFENPDMTLEKLNSLGEKFDIHFTPGCLLKQFAFCHSVHNFGTTYSQTCNDNAEGDDPSFIEIGGLNSGVTPSNGSLACISYTVSLEGDNMKEHLESCEEFEFEIGNEAVLPHLEAAVAQMAVGQSAYFRVELPPEEFILAAAHNSAVTLSLLSSRNCKLEYSITLLQVTEPLEERMEQAQFSPPLSKQRVEFALRHIKESSATSLVDFGCGSGSLLDSLLSYPTSLEKVVGVDISKKSLARAAKSLHSKLNGLLDSKESSCKIKSAVLYDGSITKFDSRLCGFDIATCLEVIEHMEEEEASLFGDVALSSFYPKILIVSTPNYEYNVILQGSTTPQGGQEEDPDEKNQPQGCKFRNHDHKFEWTRAQFEQWASDLAERHNYGVDFSGVGGAADVEPGFASQIAIFRRREDDLKNVELGNDHCVPIWEWSREEEKIPLKEP